MRLRCPLMATQLWKPEPKEGIPRQVTSGGMLSSESELSSQPLPSRFICRSWSMVASTAPLLALKTHSMMS